ncbi:MAG: hypothetical protein GXP06_15345 [Alphaproteobacteria bacterium]|nr:hypothetical protein [Alphaproteobacteria bacterium]
MKLNLITSTIAIVAVSVSTTFAAESLESVCLSVVEHEGGDTAICSCLAEQAAGNPTLEGHLISLKDEGGADERYAAANDEGKAAIDACTG